MKKKIVIVILIIVLATVILFVELNTTDNNKKHCTIHYRTGYLIYDIESKKSIIKITEKEQIVCIKAPCNPIENKKYQKKYKNKYGKLINELCIDNTEVTVNENNISKNQKNILNELVRQ